MTATPLRVFDPAIGDRVLGGPDIAALMPLTALSTSGIIQTSVATDLTASVTQTRVGGLPLTKQINNLTAVGTAGDAVTLAALSPGQYQDVYNSDAANSAQVFPNGVADTIDGGLGGVAVNLAHAKRCRYTCLKAGVIISAQLGAVSA